MMFTAAGRNMHGGKQFWGGCLQHAWGLGVFGTVLSAHKHQDELLLHGIHALPVLQVGSTWKHFGSAAPDP